MPISTAVRLKCVMEETYRGSVPNLGVFTTRVVTGFTVSMMNTPVSFRAGAAS